MDPREYSFQQNVCPRSECISSLITVENEQTYNQICQGQTLGAPMLGVSEIGGTQGTQKGCYQFDQGQTHYTPAGAILQTSQIIGGNDEVQVQKDFPVGIMIHGGPEIGGTYAAQQEILVGTMHGEPEIGGTYGTQQEEPMGTMTGEPVIGGTGILGECYPIGQYQLSSTSVAEKRQLFKFEDGNKLNNLRSESLSGHHQAFSIPVRTTQKVLDYRGTELPEGVVSDPHNEARPSRKMIPRTPVLNLQNENIFPCKSGSDANNLKRKAVSGSLTPNEKKRAADRRNRANVKAEIQQLNDDLESASKKIDESKEKLHSALKENELLKNQGQRNVSSKSKAVFWLNFDSVEHKAKTMKMLGVYPGIDRINMNQKKWRLKVKGDFDVEALLDMLKMCRDAHLISKEDVSAMPGPSTSASLSVPVVRMR